MTQPDDDVENRLRVLERETARLRELAALATADAAAARVLAAGADRDVSDVRADVRAHTRVLSALRETQLELRTEFRESLDAQGREMREGFATVHAGMAEITALLGRIADGR